MDTQSLAAVLTILRNLRNTNPNSSGFNALHEMTGTDDPLVSLKLCQYITEQTNLATAVIANSQLSDEAKNGILTAISGVSQAFYPPTFLQPWGSFVKEPASAISNLVVLLSAVGISDISAAPQEAVDLAAEVEEMIQSFDDDALDPLVRDVGKRHMAVLATLLKHIPVFGIEAALTTYFELILKLRRSDVDSSAPAHKKLSTLFEAIRSWGERLTSIDNLVNAGARLLDTAGKAQELLKYLPKS